MQEGKKLGTYADARKLCPKDFSWREVLAVAWFLNRYPHAGTRASISRQGEEILIASGKKDWRISQKRELLASHEREGKALPEGPEVGETKALEGKEELFGGPTLAEVKACCQGEFSGQELQFALDFLRSAPEFLEKPGECKITRSKAKNLIIQSGEKRVVLQKLTGEVCGGENIQLEAFRKKGKKGSGAVVFVSDILVGEVNRLLTGLNTSEFAFGKYALSIKLSRHTPLSYMVRCVPVPGAFLSYPLTRVQVDAATSAWDEFERIIETMEKEPPVPAKNLPYQKILSEALKVLPQIRDVCLTQEQVQEAKGGMYKGILGPSFYPTVRVFAPEVPSGIFTCSCDGRAATAVAVFTSGLAKLQYNLTDGEVSLNPEASRVVKDYLLLSKHQDMVEEVYNGVCQIFGRENTSFSLVEGKVLEVKAALRITTSQKGVSRRKNEEAFTETFLLGGAYKRKLSSLKKRVEERRKANEKAERERLRARQEEEKRKVEKKLEEVRKTEHFGEIIYTAFLSVVCDNERYCTEAAAVKFLRGLSMGLGVREQFERSRYENRFGLVPGDEFETACSWLLSQGFLTQRKLQGAFGKFYVLKTTAKAQIFLLGEQESHRRQADYNEYEWARLFGKEDPQGMRLEKLIERAQYLTEHPAVYCLEEEAVKAWLARVPEAIGQYFLALYKMEEDRARKKYLRELALGAGMKLR